MSKIFDSLVGHVVGDAMGTPVEFYLRKNLQENKVTEMLGNIGQHSEPIGSWSDDTSMELALIDSIINTKTFDYDDIMNNFLQWIEKGKYTPTNHAFGVGRCCLKSIYSYKKGISPLECGNIEEQHMSNGSLMRILPVALFSFSKNLSLQETENLTKNVSALTHRQDAVQLACYIYVLFIIDLLNGINKETAYINLKNRIYNYNQESIELYSRILKDDIRTLSLEDIKSSGYIVDTLEAALWCFLKNDNYEDTIIEAINLGQDTDTIAGIAGAMASIVYGYDNIPKRWLDKLQQKEYLFDMFNKFDKLINS